MVKYHKFWVPCQFQRFLYVLTNERYKTYQVGIFILSPGSCPRGGTLGRWGGGGGGGKKSFSNMVM